MASIVYVLLSPTAGMHQYTADLANRLASVTRWEAEGSGRSTEEPRSAARPVDSYGLVGSSSLPNSSVPRAIRVLTTDRLPQDRYAPEALIETPVGMRGTGFFARGTEPCGAEASTGYHRQGGPTKVRAWGRGAESGRRCLHLVTPWLRIPGPGPSDSGASRRIPGAARRAHHRCPCVERLAGVRVTPQRHPVIPPAARPGSPSGRSLWPAHPPLEPADHRSVRSPAAPRPGVSSAATGPGCSPHPDHNNTTLALVPRLQVQQPVGALTRLTWPVGRGRCFSGAWSTITASTA